MSQLDVPTLSIAEHMPANIAGKAYLETRSDDPPRTRYIGTSAISLAPVVLIARRQG
jgi:hypothetical protein